MFVFQTNKIFFPPVFKYHDVFQDHSEDYIGNDDIIDITEVIVLQFMSLQYVIYCLENSITENIVKITFFRPSRFSQLRMIRLISADTNDLCKNYLKELRNCILCITRAWLLFCSIRIYISLHFLLILLKIQFHIFLRSVFFVCCVLNSMSS